MRIYKNCIPKKYQIYNLLHIRRMLSDDKKITNTLANTKDVEENIKVKFLIYFN